MSPVLRWQETLNCGGACNVSIDSIGRSLVHTILIFLLFGGSVGLVQPALGQRVTVRTAGQYMSGDYVFSEPTDVFAWTTGLDVSKGRFHGGTQVPFLVQSTPWVSYTGAGPIPSGGGQHGAVGGEHQGPHHGRRTAVVLPDTLSSRTSGLGDPQFRLSMDVINPGEARRLRVRVSGVLKPPLADVDAGLSTGEWDAGLGVSVSRAFIPWFVVVEGTYWWLGDMEALPLKNGVAYSLTIGQTLYDGEWGILASLTGSTSVIGDIDPPVSLNGGLSFTPGQWGLSATVGSGLTEGAADWSVGLGANVTLTE